jgi:hypothetical protein
MNMGCPISTKFQNQVFDKCLVKERQNWGEEFDHTELDFKDLVAMVHQYNETLAEETFCHFEEHHSIQGAIPEDKLILAFYQIGQYLNRSRIDDLIAEAGLPDAVHSIDEKTFAKVLGIQRNLSLLEWRSKCGFMKSEIEYFRNLLEACKDRTPKARSSDDPDSDDEDKKSEDFISLTNLAKFLAELGFEGALDHDILINALIRADHFHQSNGDEMHFEDVLLLLRHLENRKAVMASKIEKQTVAEIGLDEVAVGLFRAKFKSYAKGIGKVKNTISRKQVQLLLVSDCKVVRTQEQRKFLKEAVDHVAGPDGDSLTFTDFLRILAHLDNTRLF